MGYLVIACYRPKPGGEATLLDCVRDHLPVLRAQGLVTSRKPIVGRASDGTIVEVFEWESKEALESAHGNPSVRALWERFAAVSDYAMLEELKEARELFAHFEPVDI